MSHSKDTDYLSLSTRVHAMETRLLTRERMERMIEARDHAEAAKVLSECGYGELSDLTAAGLEAMLAQAQAEVFRDLESASPNRALVDVFRIKYDYHNAKVLVKARAKGEDAGRLLVSGGRYDPAVLADSFRKDSLSGCSDAFRAAAVRAGEALGSTGDSQLCDFILDRACYEELSAAARDSESAFVQGYVRLMVDAVNLRAAVRAARLGKGAEFLEQVLLPGGNVDPKTIAAARADGLTAVFGTGALAQAAEAGSAAATPGSGSLTEFEKLCDDAVTAYMAAARRTPFGEQVAAGYLYAREAELTAVRIIMNGRLAGLEGDVIRQRLRAPYV